MLKAACRPQQRRERQRRQRFGRNLFWWPGLQPPPTVIQPSCTCCRIEYLEVSGSMLWFRARRANGVSLYAWQHQSWKKDRSSGCHRINATVFRAVPSENSTLVTAGTKGSSTGDSRNRGQTKQTSSGQQDSHAEALTMSCRMSRPAYLEATKQLMFMARADMIQCQTQGCPVQPPVMVIVTRSAWTEMALEEVISLGGTPSAGQVRRPSEPF